MQEQLLQLRASGGVLQRIDESEVVLLAASLSALEYEKGATLIAAGAAPERLFLVLEGRVVVQNGSGLRDERGPGDVVGGLAFFSATPSESQASCLTACRCASLSREAFDGLLLRHPALWRSLQEVGLQRMRQEQLARHIDHLFGPFGKLLPYVLKDLDGEMEWVSLKSGETLCREGEEATGAFVLLSGRLQMASLVDGEETVQSTVLPGETVGEVALLSSRAHANTVYAARDSELVRLSPRSFELMLQRSSRAMYKVSSILMNRLSPGAEQLDPARMPIRSIALIPASPAVDLGSFVSELARLLGADSPVTLLDSATVERELGSPGIARAPDNAAESLRLTQWLQVREDNCRYLLYQGDREWSEWSARCARQSDQIIVVANAKDEADLGRIGSELSGPRLRWSLVLLHAPDTERPRDTARWLESSGAAAVYHVRRGNAADMHRLSRILSGNAISLVLGGGGARGFAHIGVLRAMQELAIPVDMIGGASMGSAIAALYAQCMEAAICESRARIAFDNLIDYTLPLVSLISGSRITRSIASESEGWGIEDFWLPYFCVSTNLTTARTVVHARGDAGKAIRASVSIPGVLPPIADGEHLLVDGGVLNNLPLDVMRRMNPFGKLIAIDVVPPQGPRARSGYAPQVSGWQLLYQRLAPWKRAPQMPGLAGTILQSMVVGSGDARRQSLERGLADLYLNVHVAGVSMLQFDAQEQAVRVGYESSLQPLREWREAQQARAQW